MIVTKKTSFDSISSPPLSTSLSISEDEHSFPPINSAKRKETSSPCETEYSKSFISSSSVSFSSDEWSSIKSKPTIQSPKNRQIPRIYLWKLFIKVLFSSSILTSMILGYIFSIKLLSIGTFTSIGLYGAILIGDFFVQFTCAILNRISINRIVANQRFTSTSCTILCPKADLAIVCVGYREDEKAWRECLQSLQNQTLQPRVIIAVIDGDEEADMMMANAFQQEFQGKRAKVVHFPKLLSSLHRFNYTQFLQSNSSSKEFSKFSRFFGWITNSRSNVSQSAIQHANQTVEHQIQLWIDQFHIDCQSLEALCIVQPHGHKRTAMYTSFALALYAFQIKDAIFTTDSDTLVQSNALDEMYCLLQSDQQIGGVTADVRIWNRSESILARMCSVRYWMAFNIERACQSFWRCVGCISGPMGMYRSFDLLTILGPWNLQSFFGKETTFGDDRHLTNQILSFGLKTRYTHRTFCESESPTKFVRWVKQQTRWSKSFFREAFWFPISFAYHSWWLTVETTKQTLYPFILTFTVCHFLFNPSTDPFRPLVWLATMFLVALVKSIVAVCISKDFWMLAFSGYGFVYFFGLLPSKFYALFTVNITSWGTSARSQGELRKGDSFGQRSFHVGYLVIWYALLATGMGLFLSRFMKNWLFMLVGVACLPPSILLYIDTLPSFRSTKKPTESPSIQSSSSSQRTQSLSSSSCEKLKCLSSLQERQSLSSTLVNSTPPNEKEEDSRSPVETEFQTVHFPPRRGSHRHWERSSTKTLVDEIEKHIEVWSDCSLREDPSDEQNEIQIDLSIKMDDSSQINFVPLQPPLPAFFLY